MLAYADSPGNKSTAEVAASASDRPAAVNDPARVCQRQGSGSLEASQGSSEEVGTQAQGDTARSAAACDLDAAHRPLVIIIEGTEGVSPVVLQDLIFVVSEVCLHGQVQGSLRC